MGISILKLAVLAPIAWACGCVAMKSDVDSLEERVTGVYRDVGQLQKNRDSGVGDLKKEVEELRARLDDADAALAEQAKTLAEGGATPDAKRIAQLETRLTRLADDLLALRKTTAAGGAKPSAPLNPRETRQALVDIRRSELARLRRQRKSLDEEIKALERDVVVEERNIASSGTPKVPGPTGPAAALPRPGSETSPTTAQPRPRTSSSGAPRGGPGAPSPIPEAPPAAVAAPTGKTNAPPASKAASDAPLFDKDLEALREGVRKGPGSPELNRALGREPKEAHAAAGGSSMPSATARSNPAAPPSAAASGTQDEMARVQHAFDLRWAADFKRISAAQAEAGNATELLSRIVVTTPADAASKGGYKAAVVLDFARSIRVPRADNGKPAEVKSVRIEYHWENTRWRLASLSDSRTLTPLAGTIDALTGK